MNAEFAEDIAEENEVDNEDEGEVMGGKGWIYDLDE